MVPRGRYKSSYVPLLTWLSRTAARIAAFAQHKDEARAVYFEPSCRPPLLAATVARLPQPTALGATVARPPYPAALGATVACPPHPTALGATCQELEGALQGGGAERDPRKVKLSVEATGGQAYTYNYNSNTYSTGGGGSGASFTINGIEVDYELTNPPHPTSMVSTRHARLTPLPLVARGRSTTSSRRASTFASSMRRPSSLSGRGTLTPCSTGPMRWSSG